MKKMFVLALALTIICVFSAPAMAESGNASIGVNVLLNTEVTDGILEELNAVGKVQDVIYEINALTMKVKKDDLESIKNLPYVSAANPDAQRKGAPIDTVLVDSMAEGRSTWNLDAVNVTEMGFGNRVVEQDGSGVYIAVLDTGLVDSWRKYFPEQRIAEEYAISFGGGGGESGTVSQQPNKWEHDQDSHGTHVTSTILGFKINDDLAINGVAPNAQIIPVKVLNQNGSGWSSVIARGINYVTELKKGPLASYPVVINMSLGGPVLDAVEQAAIDAAIEAGVIIVASAGNEGEVGMGYPGAYEPVISVAASGCDQEWSSGSWWLAVNTQDPTNPSQYYITDFSSRELPGQDLDVTAPGSWIVGPYQVNSGQTSFYYLGGTSMASPHVAGIVALMLQKNGSLTASDAENYLEQSAVPLPAGSRYIMSIYGVVEEISWGDDASGAGLVDAIGALNLVP